MGGYIFETSEELPRALSGFAGFSASTLFAFFWGKNYARLPGIVRVRGAAEPVGPAEESPPEECPERTAG
jgi:hypothetical protein